MEKITKILRRMDSRIKDRKKRGLDVAAIRVNDLVEAAQLMKILIDRGVYDEVTMRNTWEPDIGCRVTVTVYWTKNEKEKGSE